MKTSDFDFDLPKKYIAQSPMVPRDNSKLLIFDSKNNVIYHKFFHEITDFLNSGDCLVVNKSKVFPARIVFEKKEIFLLNRLSDTEFIAMVRPGKKFKINQVVIINEFISIEVIDVLDDGTRKIKFITENSVDLDDELEKIGKIPLPPYIEDKSEFYENYQTIYSDFNHRKSVAAPTAGLHFTDSLLKHLSDKGVNFEKVVLNVGRGTFLPVSADNLLNHVMHHEDFLLENSVAEKLNSVKGDDGRIIAVGTTSVRVLENSIKNNLFFENQSSTDLFIYPGKYKWKAVDALITNFHLPKSTLLMLVASFLENKGISEPVKKILDLYEVAKENDYRFYSFGDSMFIF